MQTCRYTPSRVLEGGPRGTQRVITSIYPRKPKLGVPIYEGGYAAVGLTHVE